MFKKLAELPLSGWASIAAVALLGVILLIVLRDRKKWTAQMVAYGALCVSLSAVLALIRLFRMPSGGSVTPASMLPVMLFAVSFGTAPGLLAGTALGLLQLLQGAYILNPWQALLDYVLAYAVLGFAGIGPKLNKKYGLYIGIAIAALLRTLCAALAGVVFWETAWWASVWYNLTYMLPDAAICVVVSLLVGKQLLKLMKQK